MKFRILILILCVQQMGFSQYCGTTMNDQKLMVENIQAQRSQWMKYMDRPETGAITYIPINFYRVSQDDGSGRVAISAIMGQLCKLNQDYEPYEIQFYLKDGIQNGIKILRSQDVYDNPSTSASRSILSSQVSRNKDAVNIFVSNSATSGNGGSGVTLGFYTRIGDYIVIQKSEVQRATTSLSHELGHFFGLAHTFFGWEGTEYDCSLPTPQFVGGVAVEYESRTKQRNGRPICQTAADGLCDTPADYNLGFGFSGGCNYVGCAKDPEEVKLDPDESNMMSYFLGCLENFSPEQIAVVMSDYNSSRRNYLRSSYIPDQTEISNEIPTLLQPENRSTTAYYDNVTFSWEPVEGAQEYVIEVEPFGQSNNPALVELVKGTSYTTNVLESRKIYNWIVRPVSEYKNCNRNSSRWRFTTSAIPTSTVDFQLDSEIALAPNPASREMGLQMNYKGSSTRNVTIEVMSLSGQVMIREAIQMKSASHLIAGTDALSPGMYSVVIRDKDRYAIKKWIKL